MKTIDFKTRSAIIQRKFPCPQSHWVLGLDIGYSAVKGMAPNKVFCFPSYARKIPENRIVLKEESESDIKYRDENGIWTVGSLAYDEVNSSEVIDSETELFGRHRYYSPMFKVIARTGIALGLIANTYGKPDGKKISIQAGLPPKYESDGIYVQEVLSGKHQFEIKVGKAPWKKFQFELAEDDIYIMPQPLGALISASIDANGHQIPEARNYFKSNLIIFDPGFGTTDDYSVRMGSVVSSETFPDLGMREVFARTCSEIKSVFDVEIQIPELQNYLEEGKIKVVDRKAMKSKKHSFAGILERNNSNVCHEAIERLKSIHDYFSNIDYIIATGGTYDAWEHIFNDTFKDMEDLKIIPGNINDPSLSNIYSNVRGYYFFLANRLAV